MTGALAAAIAMEDPSRALVRAAPQPCHLQYVYDQAAAHLKWHRPAHYAAAEQIDDLGHEEPTFAGWNVRDVAGPRLVGRSDGKVAVRQVGGDRQAVTPVGRRDA